MAFTLPAVAFLALSLLSSAAPVTKRSISTGPVIAQNFADPSFIQVGAGYYAFATTNGIQNIPVATSSDFNSWTVKFNYDALPNPGPWSSGGVWAPAVVQINDNSFVLYYTAELLDGSTHCIGAATASTPLGPYMPQPFPLICPEASLGGAIDPSGFLDTDGTRYILYKVDGNSVGGGPGDQCGQSLTNPIPTSINVQAVESDGVTLRGSVQQILEQDPNTDGPLVEAPSLALVDGTYVLFFSSHCYTTPDYNVKYAVSRNGILNGGTDYTKATSPLLQTGDYGGALFAPGGLTVGPDGSKVVFMADQGQSAIVRQMWTGTITIDATADTVSFV